MRYLCLLLITLSLITGCRRMRPDYVYTYHKEQISQDQLLRDEETLHRMSGVLRVTSTHNPDGSATLEVEVKEGQQVFIQQKLSAMNYRRGQH